MPGRDPANISRAELVALIDERDELKETVRQLRELLAPRVDLPSAWRLTQTEQRLLLALRATGSMLLHRDRAFIALYGHHDNKTPDIGILDYYFCKIRRKLREAQTGIHIETVWGHGWRLDDDSRASLNQIVAEQLATVPVPPACAPRARSAA